MAPQSHTDRDYEKELAELTSSLKNMATVVQGMIDLAITALFEHDSKSAKRLIDEDHKVNQAELDIDNLCLRVLVRRQPMASDLRVITRTLKMVTDLERVGDLAVNIGERTQDLERAGWVNLPEQLREMATVAKAMIGDAIEAFVSHDAPLAREVIGRDDALDRAYSAVFGAALQEMVERRAEVHAYIHVQSVAKYLERMGDHATNLAEQVVFMVRGEELRHKGHL